MVHKCNVSQLGLVEFRTFLAHWHCGVIDLEHLPAVAQSERMALAGVRSARVECVSICLL